MGMMLLLMLSMSLVGCSKKESISSDGSTVYCNKKATNITEHKGYEAVRDLGTGGKITYYICEVPNIDECTHNTAGVLEESMGAIKKAKYYTLYLDSYIYMYYPYDGYYIEGNAIIEDSNSYTTQQVVNIMYEDMSKLILSNDMKTVSFAEKVEVNVADWDVRVRTDEIIIPGLLRIKIDDKSVIATSQITIQNKNVGKASNEKYDYYQYDGILIQVTVGTDINELLTLK